MTNPNPDATQFINSGQNKQNSTMFATAYAPVLTISYGSRNEEILLTAQQLTIGRASTNDIVLPYNFISRLHAVLVGSGVSGYTIIDQNSTNGLLYNGIRIREQKLVDGDTIRIAGALGDVLTLTYRDLLRPAPGNARTVQLDGNLHTITLGRAPDNTIVLDYPQVSAHHAVIRRSPQGAVLQDLGSTNGTFLHGVRVHSGASLAINPGDVLQLAGYVLVYKGNSITQNPTESLRMDVIGLTKTVDQGSQVILQNVTFSIQPKEFVAIIGGSGAGKSTLMDALNGFRPAPTGQVLVNGYDYYKHFDIFRSNLGYVPQDDILHAGLTVENALRYTAKLRLPKDTADEEIEQRVAAVLEEVEMTSRRNVVISRLSGGQRKRVSIGAELLVKPRLFFLDEPTSGLDQGLDKRMMSLLRKLADQGRTVIMVTHATGNIKFCDKVIIMAPGGRLAYFGPPQEALEFFEVGDYADIYTKLEQGETSSEEWEQRYRQSIYFDRYVMKPLSEVPIPGQPLIAPNGKPPTQALAPATSFTNNDNSNYASFNPEIPGKVSGWRQFKILSARYLELLGRDKVNLLVLLLQAPIIGLGLGIVAGANIFGDGAQLLTTQHVIFLLTIVAVWLGCSNAAREITKENQIYLRERLVNLKVMPYVISKVAVMAVLCLVQSISLVGTVVVFTGSPASGVFMPAWLELIIGTWLTALAGMGMGLLVSALMNNPDKAVSLVPILLVPQIILAGLIFPVEGPNELLSYAAISKWSIEAMGNSANLNHIYYVAVANVPAQEGNPILKAGHFDPNKYDNEPSLVKTLAGDNNGSRSVHLLEHWGMLLAMIIIFVAATSFFQKRKDKAWNRR